MSMFSPNAWLSMSRSRLPSNSTADYSKDSLEGLNYLNQQHPSPRGSIQLQSEDLADNERFSDHSETDEMKRPRRRLHSLQKSRSSNDDCGHEDDDLLDDTFKADISLSSHEAESFSRAQQQIEDSELELEQTRMKSRQGLRGPSSAFGTTPTLRQVPSFGNGSCISSLSADETNYDLDDNKTVKSLDLSIGNKSRSSQGDRNHHGHRQKQIRKSSLGTDFGGAFDHLNHLINPVDLMGDDRETLLYMQHQQKLHEQHQHRRAATALPGSRLLAERPRSLHQRAASDTRSFRPAHLTLHRSTSTSSRTAYSKPVPAHATLRECMDKTKGEFSNSNPSLSNHNRCLSISSKPQILVTRSTSATVHSSAANTVSSNPNQLIGVVWNGQPIDNLIDSSGSSPSSRSFRRSQSTDAYGPGGSSSSPTRHRSMKSGSSVLDQDMYSVSNVSCNTAGARSAYTGNICHYRNNSDANSSLAKEQPTSATDDRTALSGSLDSNSTARSRRRRKPSFKDEMKFMFKKMVPSPLRNVATKKNKVNLERSRGCLT